MLGIVAAGCSEKENKISPQTNITTMEATSQNAKKVVRNFYESINEYNPQKSFDDYIADSLINYAGGGNVGRNGWLESEKITLAALSNVKVTILDQVVEGNKVVTHWTYEGTHTAPFYGKPATGNHIRLEGITIDVVENGKIVEHNLVADETQFLQQFEKK
ncbi:MAG: hypothetical protein BGO34_22150 [Bacteroidia bacterium 44-10]|nr:MAG: hypothetical protein BGO34_22150 [Bacteroidia bacterium 44-10]